MARRFTLAVAVLATIPVGACHESSPTTPVGPTTPPPLAAAPPPDRPASATYPLSGVYDLTLTLGDDCTAVPAAARTRSYTATIAYADAGRYLVTLGGAEFLSGPICTGGGGRFRDVGCNQFVASEDIDMASIFLENNNDDAHGGHIVERLPSGQWLEIIGTAGGPFDLATVRATGSGLAWYCPAAVAYPFPCPGFVSCQTTDLRMTLTRR